MRHSISSTPNGLTLLEVIAGLALLATLLTMILVAFGSNLRQVRRSQQRLAAIHQADLLLGEWLLQGQPDSIPRDGSGDIPDDDQMIWRTHEIPEPQATDLGVCVVRLEILDRKNSATNKPLASVDFVLPTVIARSEATKQSSQGLLPNTSNFALQASH